MVVQSIFLLTNHLTFSRDSPWLAFRAIITCFWGKTLLIPLPGIAQLDTYSESRRSLGGNGTGGIYTHQLLSNRSNILGNGEVKT